MLMQFPMAHDDELLGSVIARFVKRQGLEDDKVALRQLFASQKIVPSSVLQGHANQLLANIGHLWTISPRELLEKHTLLPVFRPFVASKAYNHFVRDLCDEGKNHSMLRTGVNASNIVWPSNFRICPLCCQQQSRRFGYLYWQRLFQCPGVEACPEHGCLLIDTGVPLQSHRRHRFVGTQAFMQDIPAVSPLADRKDLLLSIGVSDLLRCKTTETPNNYQWSRFYRALARQRDICRGKGVQHKEVAARVRAYWGVDWLERQGLTLDVDESWLVSMFRKHRRPFSYLQHFVCWFALCDKKPVLSDVLAEASQFSNQPLRKAVYFSPRAEEVCHQYRALWNEILGRYGSLRDVRKHREGARVYSWLYRFDSQWLALHKPEKISPKSKPKVDWTKRDQMIVREVFAIERSVWQDLGGPRRSKSWYCKQVVSRRILEKKLSKLPLCREFFVRYAETVDEYQTRRLACIFARLVLNNGWRIPIYEIERMAGLNQRKCREAGRQILYQAIPAWCFSEEVAFRQHPQMG
ncbi:Tn7-like transposition protein D [Marinobacter antarcticus]|uniref:Tn7-like transposition protein D n=1 Tax=Marinobacter antarcticus TaxID=564117 RepID=A0A1M6PZE4_9GAMM|nr:TnsD family Tn7-like transposition protein [Marinobacter antarcticus]SHK13365.1 Tn7-like transposition protein D [Marinobacter antarcticus]